MDQLFLKILGMSMTASAVTAVVILLRLMLKKAPKIFSYLLWAAVFFRLLCPFEINLPKAPVTPVSVEITNEIPQSESVSGNYGSMAFSHGTVHIYSDPSQHKTYIAAVAASLTWICGMTAMAAYGTVSYIKLKRMLKGSKHCEGNAFASDRITNAFIIGIFRPRIYIPSGFDDSKKAFILKHESVHLKRGDHIVKLIMFAALCIHWFNPLVWLSFKLCERDMEMSCDEAVTKNMDRKGRADYSQALLEISSGKTAMFTACFSESGTKQRIKNVLNFRKPAVWIIILGTAAAVIAFLMIFSGKRADTASDFLSEQLKAEPEIIAVYDGEKEKITDSYTRDELLKYLRSAKLEPADRDMLDQVQDSIEIHMYEKSDSKYYLGYLIYEAAGKYYIEFMNTNLVYCSEMSYDDYTLIKACLDSANFTAETADISSTYSIPLTNASPEKLSEIYFGSQFPCIVYADDVTVILSDEMDCLYIISGEKCITSVSVIDIGGSFRNSADKLPFRLGTDSWNGIDVSASENGEIFCTAGNAEESITFIYDPVYFMLFEYDGDIDPVKPSYFGGEPFYYGGGSYVSADLADGFDLTSLRIKRHTADGEYELLPFPENGVSISPEAQKKLKFGTYSVRSDSDIHAAGNVSVYSDGTAVFSFSMLSSRIITGLCTVEGDKAVITGSEGTSVFAIDGDKLIYNAKESTEKLPDYYDSVSDGTVLYFEG